MPPYKYISNDKTSAEKVPFKSQSFSFLLQVFSIYEYSLVINPILAVDYLSLSLNSVNYFAVETVGARLQFSLG